MRMFSLCQFATFRGSFAQEGSYKGMTYQLYWQSSSAAFQVKKMTVQESVNGYAQDHNITAPPHMEVEVAKTSIMD